jgi:hypothetical protein
VDLGGLALHGVPDLHHQPGRRLGVRGQPGAVRPAVVGQRTQQPVDEGRNARGAGVHPAGQLLHGRPVGAAEPGQQPGPHGDAGRVEHVEQHRGAPADQRGPQRGGAVRARPRAVRDHQVTVRAGRQCGQSLQLGGREQVRVVDQHGHRGRQRFGGRGHPAPDRQPGRLERPGQRLQQHGLAVPAGPDHVHPADGGRPGCGVPDQSAGHRGPGDRGLPGHRTGRLRGRRSGARLRGNSDRPCHAPTPSPDEPRLLCTAPWS